MIKILTIILARIVLLTIAFSGGVWIGANDLKDTYAAQRHIEQLQLLYDCGGDVILIGPDKYECKMSLFKPNKKRRRDS